MKNTLLLMTGIGLSALFLTAAGANACMDKVSKMQTQAQSQTGSYNAYSDEYSVPQDQYGSEQSESEGDVNRGFGIGPEWPGEQSGTPSDQYSVPEDFGNNPGYGEESGDQDDVNRGFGVQPEWSNPGTTQQDDLGTPHGDMEGMGGSMNQ